MDITAINSAIDSAFAAALANPQRVMAHFLSENVKLQTDTYVAPNGAGFRVVCQVRVPPSNRIVTRVKNHGPDIKSEKDWPQEGIENMPPPLTSRKWSGKWLYNLSNIQQFLKLT
jgi:hypothetical protein